MTSQEVSRAIVGVKYLHGKTMTAAALRHVRLDQFSAAHARRGVSGDDVTRVALIVTDGESDNEAETMAEAVLLRDAGVSVLAMGVGGWVRRAELEGMASHPKQRNVFTVDRYEALFQIADPLMETVCDGESTARTRVLFISSHLFSSLLISSHLFSSLLISSHLFSSLLISSHLFSSLLICLHLLAFSMFYHVFP